ncbi:MAG: hypothetical protein IJ689_06875 [Alphaproteobacteria bacterium]|nr:hypothetical protein [Alphaproteobacteria bacterium]
MKNYILMLGVAGVALGSYCAYAGNSATMTVTATIAHDVSLNVTQDLNIGTITVNPSVLSSTPGVDFTFDMDASGTVSKQGLAIISITGTQIGSFTANIPNPSACDTPSYSCGGLGFKDLPSGEINPVFGNTMGNGSCFLKIVHSTGNVFKVYSDRCEAYNLNNVKAGKHEKSIVIEYTAS